MASPEAVLWTAANKGVLETQEIEQVADEWTCGRVAVAGVGIAGDVAVLV